MTSNVRLGSFYLEEPLSSGGMGIVWRGLHAATSTPVAVKVIAANFARDPVYLDGFDREVRAVARMQHPRIIRVYDSGTVGADAAAASHEELPAGAPWLAMELAERGSLARMTSAVNWPTLQAILFDILDALAHSHARGIIHRDLKPGNVLLAQGPDGLHCKLTDFGIAHASEGSTSTREVFATSAGTPWYMAPEQVDSRWRDYGPWTDLYALGCVAYQLATGVTPFVGESVVRVARQQLFDSPPPLAARFAVPPGFGAWVDRLLVKDISKRFRRAADAAWALQQIAPRRSATVELAQPPRVSWSGTGLETTDIAPTNLIDPFTPSSFDSRIATLTFLEPIDAPKARAAVEEATAPFIATPAVAPTFGSPPAPATWRGSEPSGAANLLGAGLGLYRMRETPFVGREEERDRLWEALREVSRSGIPRGVVIGGAAGSGKSRLVDWIAMRAHELGVASVFRAEHSLVRGPMHGLAPMLERYLGCRGLDKERCYLRIRKLIASRTPHGEEPVSYYAAALAEILRPGVDADGVPIVRFGSPDERYKVAEALLTGVTDLRPVLLVIDDAQWGFETLELARRLLGSPSGVAVFLTVSHDQLEQRPLERDALRELQKLGGITAMELGALSQAEHLELIDELMVLDPRLRDEVLEQTYGSPLFVAELLGEWVRHGCLKAGPRGFTLPPDAPRPSDLHSLWIARLDEILRQLDDPDSARIALEIGAALGTNVNAREWSRACEAFGVEVDPHLVDLLTDNGLLERREGGWSFRNQMLRDGIAEQARDARRAEEQHRVLADVLQSSNLPDDQFRRALHCREARDFRGAALSVLDAMGSMTMAGRIREAAALANFFAELATHLAPDDPLVARSIAQRLRIFARQQIPQGLEYALKMLPVSRKYGWLSTESELERFLGKAMLDRGSAATGRERLDRSLVLAERSGDPDAIAYTHHAVAWFDIRFGDLEQALAHLETAREHFAIAANSEGECAALSTLAEVERQRAHFDAARELNQAAVDLARSHGYRSVLVTLLITSGEIAQSRGDVADAAAAFTDAGALARLTGNRNAAVADFDLGGLILREGDARRARPYIASAIEEFEAMDWGLYAYVAGLALLACAAALGDADEWDRQFTQTHALAAQDFAFRESVEYALLAAEHWTARGDSERGTAAFELALALIPAGFAAELEPKVRAKFDEARQRWAREQYFDR